MINSKKSPKHDKKQETKTGEYSLAPTFDTTNDGMFRKNGDVVIWFSTLSVGVSI